MTRQLVVHFDGDSFFVSCELLKRPDLRGKSVVTGGERGIATAMNREAKALGITRGMPSFMIRRMYPQTVILRSDYDLYKQYARRMFSIAARHAEVVEEYSIDECFALVSSVEAARRIKMDLENELGITFGTGVGSTKTLAKAASKKSKPAGFMVCDEETQESLLSSIACVDVWGIGPSAAAFLRERGFTKALDFANSPEWWAKSLPKPLREKRSELRGERVFTVGGSSTHFVKGYAAVEEIPQSILSSLSLPAPLTNPRDLLIEIARHVEDVCYRARRVGVVAGAVSFFLKTSDFKVRTESFSLDRPTASPGVVMAAIRERFNSVYLSGLKYRTTGACLRDLREEGVVQEDVFGGHVQTARQAAVLRSVDAINVRYPEAVLMASALSEGDKVHQESDSLVTARSLFGKPFSLPYLGDVR